MKLLAILNLESDGQKPCQNKPDMAFISSLNSNFPQEIVTTRHFYAIFPFEQGTKPLKRSTFLVISAFLVT